MAEVSESPQPEISQVPEPASEFDPKTMRKTKPGLKRLVLTLSVFFSFVIGFPFLWKTVEIYRAPLPFREVESLSAQLDDSNTLLFPCHFQAIFLGFNSESSIASSSADHLQSSILNQMTKFTPQTPQCGTCSTNYTVSVVVDSDSHCLQSQSSKSSSCPWKCGSMNAVDFDSDDDTVDDLLESVLGGGCSEVQSSGKMYTVVWVSRDGEVRAVVGKHRHAWVSGRVSEAEAAARVAEIFVKVFVNGGKEEGLIHQEFIPVGADGRIVLSFNLLNAEPRDWIYDWYGAVYFVF